MSSTTAAFKAIQISSCKAQPACTLVCETEQAAVTGSGSSAVGWCERGAAADWKCDTTGSFGNSAKRVVKSVGSVSLTSDCNVIDCSICLKMATCAKKKIDAAASGSCFARCNKLAPVDATVECLFCGPKAAGCA